MTPIASALRRCPSGCLRQAVSLRSILRVTQIASRVLLGAMKIFSSTLLALTLAATISIRSSAADEKKAADEVAVIKTNQGTMVLEFYPEVAPKHVENFKTLAKKGFYDGTAFHRVIKGFMIQGGDPLTKDDANQARWGTGDPGYKIKAEFNDKPHLRGTLSAARSQDPDSAGSQFFICHSGPKGESPRFLDHQYTVFGQLIKGDDVLEKIATTETAPGDRPLKKVTVESVKIVPRSDAK